MSTPNLQITTIQSATLRARSKLPDDLSILEYARISNSIQKLITGANWSHSVEHTFGTIQPSYSRGTLLEARYGSPLEMLIAVPPIIAATLATLCKAVNYLANAARDNAEIAKIDAETARAMAETDLLRMQVELTYRQLSKGSATRRALYNQLSDSGNRLSAEYVMKLGRFWDSNHSAEAKDLEEGVTTLASFNIKVDVLRSGEQQEQ